MQKAITLVLGGGSAKGLAHIGVLEVLQENKIPIKRIIGTSSGALIGAAYCSNTMKDMKKTFLKSTPWLILKMFAGIPSKNGLFSSKKMDIFLKRFFKNKKIEQLSTSLTTIGYNLTKNKLALFDKGDLYTAVKVSTAVLGYFEPVIINNETYVDGGLRELLPISTAKKYKSTKKILAVDVEKKSPTNKDKIIYRIRNKLFRSGKVKHIKQISDRKADLIIYPNVKPQNFQYYKAKEIIAEGRKTAEAALPRIKKLINS